MPLARLSVPIKFTIGHFTGNIKNNIHFSMEKECMPGRGEAHTNIGTIGTLRNENGKSGTIGSAGRRYPGKYVPSTHGGGG